MTKDNRFSPEVEKVLLDSGWYPGRVVEESQLEQWYVLNWGAEIGYCRIFPSALKVLREFGGLSIEQDEPGLTCYRSSFYCDPFKAIGIMDHRWIAFEWFLDTRLYPLGVKSSQDIVVAISQKGHVYFIDSDGQFVNENFDGALENFIIGIRGKDIPVDDARIEIEKEAFQVREAERRFYRTV
jgi:hypothetical protein